MSQILSILNSHCPSMDNLFMDNERRAFRDRIFDAMKEYSEKCSAASLKKSSENLSIYQCKNLQDLRNTDDKYSPGESGSYVAVDRKSIVDPKNIILL